ncbi:hypothetical protein NDU88_009304 [Pleurodeles waltl]|uniref:Uncharacterized protein n=1 Tax=Pleurodeles waltl TaxID=8319 RepID=A0AAV7RVR2_PLEWA|nr:hypothetical protein NDU88_009304 [Pleurodeles waltl]
MAVTSGGTPWPLSLSSLASLSPGALLRHLYAAAAELGVAEERWGQGDGSSAGPKAKSSQQEEKMRWLLFCHQLLPLLRPLACCRVWFCVQIPGLELFDQLETGIRAD